MMHCAQQGKKKQKSNECKGDKEKMAAARKPGLALKKGSASRVVDTLRTKPWQCVFDCDTARRRFGCPSFELLETLPEVFDVDFWLLWLPLLLL